MTHYLDRKPQASALRKFGYPRIRDRHVHRLKLVLLLISATIPLAILGRPASAQEPAQGQAARPAAAVVPGDAYLDPAAAEIVRRARERKEGVDRSLLGYRAVAKERVGVGIRALRRDRILYEHELVARITWRRGDTARVEALGARTAVPIARGQSPVPQGLRSMLGQLAFNPDHDLLRFRPSDSAETDNLHHPLAAGSEADYRFRSGDTTVITFQDGRTLRVYELVVLPRRSSFWLIAGSFWFDAETYGLVRAVFRTARPFDLTVDGDVDDANDVPAVFRPIRAEIRYITIEYGLQAYRWWLPRLMAIDAVAQLGSLMQIPVRFERIYEEYQVDGGAGLPAARAMPLPVRSASAAPARVADSTNPRGRRRAVTLSIGGGGDSTRSRRAVRADSTDARHREHEDSAHARRARADSAFPIAVTMPPDSISLAESPYLPAPIFEPGPSMVTETDLREVARVAGLLPVMMMPPSAGFRWAPRDPTMLRFNRVEGLSFGARLDAESGVYAGDATVRFGVADLVPNAELGLTRSFAATRLRLGGFYRLATVDPETKPFGIGNSLAGLLFGRDDGDYYRALGAEFTAVPSPALAQWFTWRLYVERQRAVAKETDLSLWRLLSSSHRFRENVTADRATEVGAALTLRGQRGADPGHLVLGADLFLEGATGTFDYGRGALAARVGLPLPFGVAGAVEAAAGSSVGAVPVQGLWYLGGPATLRGYAGAAAAGDAFWRARVELASQAAGARLALFGDAGWAGARGGFAKQAPLLAWGVGASFLDGLVRLDVSRGVRWPAGWRVDLYWDGAL